MPRPPRFGVRLAQECKRLHLAPQPQACYRFARHPAKSAHGGSVVGIPESAECAKMPWVVQYARVNHCSFFVS